MVTYIESNVVIIWYIGSKWQTMQREVLVFLTVGTTTIWIKTSTTPNGASRKKTYSSICRTKLVINGH